MSYLLKFLKQYHYIVLFVVLQVLSLVLLARFNNYQASVFLSSANEVSGKIHSWTSEVTGYFGLKEANKNISQTNARLSAENIRLKSIIESLTQDSLALQACEQSTGDSLHLILTKVVNNSVIHANNFITINKGRADGIKEEMGVISGTGVVGIVYLSGDHYSIVLPILNSKSSISCKISRTDYFGSLHWDGISSQYAYIEDLPLHAEFSLGDSIITSGHSTVFPEGLHIGTIDDMTDSRDGQSFTLKVKLAADFARLRDLIIIDNSRKKAQRIVEDSLKNSLEK